MSISVSAEPVANSDGSLYVLTFAGAATRTIDFTAGGGTAFNVLLDGVYRLHVEGDDYRPVGDTESGIDRDFLVWAMFGDVTDDGFVDAGNRTAVDGVGLGADHMEIDYRELLALASMRDVLSLIGFVPAIARGDQLRDSDGARDRRPSVGNPGEVRRPSPSGPGCVRRLIPGLREYAQPGA